MCETEAKYPKRVNRPVPDTIEDSRAQVLMLYYSSLGHVEKLAHEIAAGAREAGTSSDVKRMPELLSPEAAKVANYKLDRTAPVARIEDLAEYDAIAVGTGTRFGRVSSHMASFLVQAGAYGRRGSPRQGRRPSRRWRRGAEARRRRCSPSHQRAPLRHDGGRTKLRIRRPDDS